MGERLELRVFKGASETVFRRAVDDMVTAHGGEVQWDCPPKANTEDFRTSHNVQIHGFYIPFNGVDYILCQKIGDALAIPWIELRIQEGSLWDYSLYHGKTHLDNFSTWPEYWGETEEWNASQRGNPQLLADMWDIPREIIENYLKPWGTKVIDEDTIDTVLRGKAYEDDICEYGSIWQMFDFLRALGGLDPMDLNEHGRQHRMKCPSAESLTRSIDD